MVDVPHLADLVEARHATVIERSSKTGAVSVARATPHGQALIYAAMHTNAAAHHLATMRALDPEGPTDMDQARQDQIDEALRLRPELTVLQCPAVHAETGTRCTRVEGHLTSPKPTAHDAGVTFETNASIHMRVIGTSSW